MTSRRTRTIRGTSLAGGEAAGDAVDAVLNNVTSATDSDNAARHIAGDLTVEGTVYANAILSQTTWRTSDPRSKYDMVPLSPAEAAAALGKLQVYAYSSKLDPTGRRNWGLSAAEVAGICGGDFVRMPAGTMDKRTSNGNDVDTHTDSGDSGDVGDVDADKDKTNVVDNNGGHVTSQYMAIDAASIAAGMYAMVLELYKDYETRCQRRCVDDS